MIANGRWRRIAGIVPYYLPSPPIWQYGYMRLNSKIVFSYQLPVFSMGRSSFRFSVKDRDGEIAAAKKPLTGNW